MDSGQDSKPRPLASPPLARMGEHSAHKPRGRSGTSRLEDHLTIAYRDRAIAKKDVQSEILILESEIFKEELSYRAQARKFLWEFFD
jgi:hypothetical protein